MKQNDAQKVTVIGAGTMGSGIAMHLANCGFKVSLLDLTLESVNAAFQRAKNVKPPHLYNEQSEHRITLGSIADNLNEVCDSNWVCEAIIEKLDAKRDLYAQLEPLLAAGTFISTNTSGIELSLLKEGRSDSFRRNFLGTHFFNPPRYLKLLELIPTDETDPDEISRMTEY
jgi:3-hydroxyacyl-CoA dehydrogenase